MIEAVAEYTIESKIIEEAWDGKICVSDSNFIRAIKAICDGINNGKIRVSSKHGDNWVTNEWVKKAILLIFKMKESNVISGSPAGASWFDKIPLKFEGWDLEDFKEHAIRSVPGSFVRSPAYIAKNVVLMPSFVNIGAYIGENTMIDVWATVGSCAQIGKNCHISGGTGIAGVLEPIQANPVIIEDDCFIGARSEIVEGVIVKKGSVISMGVYIGASTKIIDKETGEIIYGYVPEYSVVIPGSYKLNDKISTYCAIIIKKVDEQTRRKTAINELLRLV